VSEAGRLMYEVDGMWMTKHSHYTTLEYVDSHLCGPYDLCKRLSRMIGMAFPLDMYSPRRQAEIRANPDTRLVFNQVPITATLKAELMAQKDGAVRLMEEAITLWRSLEGRVEEGKYRQVLAGLEGNRDDTFIFRYTMDLYLDWKLGVLTEAKIDAVLAAEGLHGVVVPEPLAERVAAQEELLGASVDAHPLELAAAALANAGAIGTVAAASALGHRVRVAGMRQTWRRTRTLRGDHLYFMALEDLEGVLDVMISAEVYRRSRAALRTPGPYVVEGVVTLDVARAEPTLRAERIGSVAEPGLERARGV